MKLKFWQNWFKKIETAVRVAGIIPGFNRYSWNKWDYRKFVEEGYETNPYIFRAVNFLAGTVASLDWSAYRVVSDEREELPDTHPLRRIIASPNKQLMLSMSMYMQTMVTYLLLGGVAPTIKVRSGSITNDNPVGTGEVQMLMPIQPDKFGVIRGGMTNPIAGFEYNMKRSRLKLRREDVIYMRIFNPLDLTGGFPPLAAAARSVDMLNEADMWNISLLNNDCRPPGMFKVAAHLEDDEFHEGKKRMIEQIGSATAGRPIFADSDSEWIPFSYSPADLNHENLMKVKAREIALVFNIPPKLMSETESQNYASLSAAIKQGVIEGALPIANMIRHEINTQLAPDFVQGNEIIEVDYDRDKIEALQEEQSELWQRVTAAKHLSVNEKRLACGYDEIEGGDVVLVPSNEVPLDLLSATEEEENE